MSKMRIVMFGLAIGSAVMAGVLAKKVIGKKPEAAKEVVTKVETTDVLIAAKDLATGERLAAGAVLWKAWPNDNIQEAMITKDEKPDAEQVFGEARAILPIFEGETINEKKIVLPGTSGFMAAVLPKGMTAVSVAISDRTSAGGFILPNDRVEVILTRKINGAKAAVVKSEVVLTNVRILAINQVYRQAQEGDEVSLKEGQTATLEVTLEQAEILARVETEGDLSLALRSLAESDGKASEIGPQLAEKYRGGGKVKAGKDTLFVRFGIETYATSN